MVISSTSLGTPVLGPQQAVTVASFIGALVAVVSWAVSACILIKVNFSLFNVGVLIDGRDHLTNPPWWLMIEFGADVLVMESSNEGGDDFCFRDVRNRIPHLEKMSDEATEKLRQFLIDAIQIVLGARLSTCSHVVVGEDLLQLLPRSDGIRGEARKPVQCGWREHDGKIVCHDTGISPGGTHNDGISL